MPFTVVKGEFVPEAGRPDGDSMRFRPDDPSPIFKLKRRGFGPKINGTNGTIQLRFEGIDTMESKAAKPFSSDATLANLELCGVPDGTGTSRGYILSNQIGPNGRPIAFVFAGEPDEDDGSETFLDADRMKDSVNYKQIEQSHAYPLFYDTLYSELRIALADAVVAARESGSKIWSSDATNSGVSYTGSGSLETMSPIFPKLWRRLDSYSKDRDIMNPDSLSEFFDYLETQRDERIFIISEGKATGLNNMIQIHDSQIKITHNPEDLVVVSI